MKRLAIVLMLLTYTLPISAQERQVARSELHRKLSLGVWHIEQGPHRFTVRSRKRVITMEDDGEGNVRAVVLHSGSITSECIIIGDQIYEPKGDGGWTVQTRAEYDRSAKSRAAATREVLLKGGNIISYKGPLALINQAAMAAIDRQLVDFRRDLTNSSIADPAVTFVGNQEQEGRLLHFYRLRVTVNKVAAPHADARFLRLEVLYGLDEKTGALFNVRTQHDWVYDSKTKTDIRFYEWEPDPSIVIRAPAPARPFN